MGIAVYAWWNNTRKILLGSLVTGAWMVAAGTVPGVAQTVHTVSAEPGCAACLIRLEKITQLGDIEGPGIIESDIALAVRDSRGRYYVTTSYGRTIKVFDATGKYITEFGGTGHGPGEFQSIGAVRVGEGDTLHVFDNTLLRHSVFSPSYEHVRSIGLEIPPTFEVELIEDTLVVLAAPVRTPDRVGLPLHLMSRNGDVIRSFGSDQALFRADVPFIDSRTIAGAGRDRVWSAFRNQYVVELFDAEGEKLKELVRRAPWFPSGLVPDHGESRSLSDDPPSPRLQAIRQSESGLLWVMISVADNDWKRGVRSGGSDHGGRIDDWNLYYDTILEVINPESGELIQSQRFPLAFSNFVDDDLIGAVELTDAAVPILSVWRVRLTNLH